MPKWAAATLSDTCYRPDRNCCNHNPNVTGGSRTLANDKAYRHGGSATHSCSNAYVCSSTDSHSGTITTGGVHANAGSYSGADARRYSRPGTDTYRIAGARTHPASRRGTSSQLHPSWDYS